MRSRRSRAPQTIVQIVLADDQEFDVLQAAVVKANLVEALNGTTQYTVFAPTDQAFVTTLGVANEAAAIQAPGYQMLNGDTLTRRHSRPPDCLPRTFPHPTASSMSSMRC
jgi:hypothetical protein